MWAGTLQNTLDLGGLPPIRATGCLDLAREHVSEVLVGRDPLRLPLADLADHRLGVGVGLPLRANVGLRGLLLGPVPWVAEPDGLACLRHPPLFQGDQSLPRAG